jgi:hypothetical protein
MFFLKPAKHKCSIILWAHTQLQNMGLAEQHNIAAQGGRKLDLGFWNSKFDRQNFGA